MPEYKDDKKYDEIFLAFLVVLTALRLLFIGTRELFYDEAFYWVCSRHLALSYYDNPPLIGYLIRFFTAIGGQSEFFVRVASPIFATGFTCLVYLLAWQTFNKKAALIAVFMVSLIPIYIPVGLLILPDIIFGFFWIGTIYVLWKIFSADNPPAKLWYLAGLTAGLGFMTKHHMSLILPCLMIYLLLSRKNRHWLRRREPYIALGIMILLASPVFIWNLQHDFASMRFQLVERHSGKVDPLIGTHFIFFLVSQSVVLTPVIYLLLLASLAYSFYEGMRKRKENLLYLACMSAPVLALFSFFGVLVLVKAHWAACGYIAGLVVLGGLVQEIGFSMNKAWRRLLLFPSLLVAFFPIMLTYLFSIAVSTGSIDRLPLPEKVYVYLQNRLALVPTRWKQVGAEINNIYGEMSQKNNTFIFSARDYSVISLVAYYTGKPEKCYLLNAGKDSKQFDFWQDDLGSLAESDAVFIGRDEERREFDFAKYFHQVKEERSMNFGSGEKRQRALFILRCYNFKRPLVTTPVASK